MVKFTGVFDNSIASPLKPLDFVKEYYLTTMGRKELIDSSIQQESNFAALKNEESAQHSLQQLKADILRLKKEFIFCEPNPDYKRTYNQAIDDVIAKLSAV